MRRRSVEATRASPVAVALAEERSGHPPLRDHDRDRASWEWAANDKDATISQLACPAGGRLRNRYGSRVVVELPSPAAGAALEATAAAARVIRTARATEPSMRTAATKNGMPGRVAGALGLMNQAKTSVNRIGPMTPVRPAMLALAPCNCPCSDGRTRRVMRLCNAGWTKPIGANTTIARRKTLGVGARPHTTKAAAPAIRPVISAFRSPKRLMNRFTRPPWTVMFNAPTTASDTPTSIGPHPYR